jgi:aspartyl-tRNA(Asn)/glutamyl-tRNA(Gln) amidotransferase subunit A
MRSDIDETLDELASALGAGRMTSQALVERSLARIARFDRRLNSFVALDEPGAIAAARESDARLARGAARSKLEGIPLSIKDNIQVAGLPSTWGSRGLVGFKPTIDELPVARLRAAEAVILGKTNVPEFTLEGYTSNNLFGVTRNPWNEDLTPGGSIRRPACHTGLIGWKPSIGRWPRIDGFPAILTDFETLGTLTRTLDDLLTLDEILKGPDARDTRSLYREATRRASARPRILYAPRFGDAPVDPEVAGIVADFARTLERDGCEIRKWGVFFDLEDAGRIWQVVSRAGVAWLMRENATYEGEAGASARAMAAEERKLTGAEYIDALERVAAFRRRSAELFAEVDLVLTPTAAAPPWQADKPYPDQIDGRRGGPRDHAIFTGWANIAGVPAINLPVGVSKSALPIGAQLAAGFGADAWLLDFARDVSRMFPPPPLPVMKG